MEERQHIDVNDEDALNTLLAGISKEKLSKVIASLQTKQTRAPRDPRKEPGPVKTYLTVKKKYTCLACDSKFSVEYKMSKGEEITTVERSGRVTTIILAKDDGELTLECFCSKCHHCADVAKTWSREELEERWIRLISCAGFKEVAKVAR